ncbi:DNA-methyltransferase [Candidatus Neomarinimicrobiota bacterium]
MTASLQDAVLYQDDFFRQWQLVPDGSVDLAICDPPYNVLQAVHSWDKKIDFAVLSWILSQLLTPFGQVALFCSAKMIPEVVSEFGKYFEFRYPEVWHKPSAMASHKDRPKPDVEFVCVFHRKGTRKQDRIFNWEPVASEGKPYIRRNPNRKHPNRKTLKREVDINDSGLRYPSSVVHFPNRPAMTAGEKRLADHPTQKSLEHMEYLIQLLSIKGQTILAPFMGSGTAIMAAVRTDRRAIGFEIESKYYEMAKTRLGREVAQRVLL